MNLIQFLYCRCRLPWPGPLRGKTSTVGFWFSNSPSGRGVLYIERERARKRFRLHVQSFPNEHTFYIKKIPWQWVAGRRGQKVMGINGEKKPHVKCNAAKTNKQTNKNHTAAHSR